LLYLISLNFKLEPHLNQRVWI